MSGARPSPSRTTPTSRARNRNKSFLRAGNGTSYRELTERVERLQRLLTDEREENRLLKQDLAKAWGDRNAFRRLPDSDADEAPQGRDRSVVFSSNNFATINEDSSRRMPTPITSSTKLTRTTSTPSHKRVKRVEELPEVSTLQRRYDELLEAHTSLREHYKVDYRKWHGFKSWLFDEEKQNKEKRSNKNEDGMSKEERKKRANARIWAKRQMFLKIGPDLTALERDDCA
jgi:hypothetical protein